MRSPCAVPSSPVASRQASSLLGTNWLRTPRFATSTPHYRGRSICKGSLCAASSKFDAQLQECESSGDWLKAVEIVAEARALKAELSPEAVEAAIRNFASHGQHKRAVGLFQSTPTKAAVSLDTLRAIFAALLQASEAALSTELLKEIDWERHGEEAKAEAHNTVARTCARGGMLNEGLALLEHMQKSSVEVGRATFDSLALGCLQAGRGEEAEQLFDERDYL